MKKNLLFILTLTSISLTAFSQTKKLSFLPKYPKKGSELEIIYKPDIGSKFSEKDTLFCKIDQFYEFTYSKKSIADIKLIRSGHVWKGHFKLSDSVLCNSLQIMLPQDNNIKDDNDGLGYFILPYQGKDKPVLGSLTAQGMITAKGLLLTKSPEQHFQKINSLFQLEDKLYPDAKKNTMVLEMRYFALMFGKNVGMLDSLKKEIKQSLRDKTNQNETNLFIAWSIFISDVEVRDSIASILNKKYPNGNLAKIDLMKKIQLTKDINTKLSLHDEFVKRFSIQDPVYNSIASGLAGEFAQKGDIGNFKRFLTFIKDSVQAANLLNNYAWSRTSLGKGLDTALSFSRRSLDIIESFRQNPPASWVNYPIHKKDEEINKLYVMYADTYAYILYKQNKFKEALDYQQRVMGRSKNPANEIKERYAIYLEKNNRGGEAKPIVEEMILKGIVNKDLVELAQRIYKSEKNSAINFDTYLSGLKAKGKAYKETALIKGMVHEPAPLFSLKTLEGKTVSLADLKGKVVVLDFWATWCGPCVASFPAMQAAQEKYKDNPAVKFLFINTWENKPELAAKFINDKKYPFEVAMDNMIKDVYTTATDYNVKGIPAKFIIDKNGVIRFKASGFGGNKDEVVEELSRMIELVSK